MAGVGSYDARHTVWTATPHPNMLFRGGLGWGLDVPEIDVAAVLARFPVFEAMTPAGRSRLAAAGRDVALAPGVFLFRRGDASDAVYVILTGAAEVTLTDEEGRVSVLARLGPGDIMGEMGAFSGQPRSADICIARRSQLWRIGSGAVREVLEAEGRAAMALVGLLVARLRETDDLVQRSQWRDVGARLAQVLMQQAPHPVTASQGELARQIGASREAVNRRLSDWRGRGWVELNASGLHVRRPQALQELYEPGDLPETP